ncbi:MAG: hypothetical protein AAF804_07860, partial [Bacteroidota bacterium]
MRKQFIVLLLLSIIGAVTCLGQADEGLARVYKINGKEAYILSEPLRSYEVVFDVGTGLKAASILTAGLVNEGVSAKAAQFVRKIQEEAEAQGIEYDAVIYASGKSAAAITFTDDNKDQAGLARVKEIDGVEIYIQSEPLKEYEILTTSRGGIKAKSYLTAGLVNNSIEQDVAQFVRKLTN